MAGKSRLENVMKSYLSSEDNGNSKSSANLDKFLRCMVCNSYYNDPRIFSCGHSACFNCLSEHIRDNCRDKHVNCPACETPVECKSGNASDFPKSRLLGTLSQLQQQQANSVNQVCEFCKQSEDKNEVAFKFCVDCTHYLCKSCSDNHNRTMLTRNHQLVDAFRAGEHLVHARSRAQMCSDHRDKVADLYCKRCDRVLCQVCAIVVHRQHPIVDIPSVAGQLKLDLQKALVDVERRIHVYEKYGGSIDEVNKKNERLNENLTDHISKWADDVRRRVDTLADKLKQQIRHKNEELNRLHHVYAEKANDRLELFRGLHECIGELLRVGTPNELYHLSADVKSYLQAVDGGSFSTNSVPALQLLCLNDKLLTSVTFASEAANTQADADERDEPRKVEELDQQANEEQQRLRIISTVKHRVEPASVSKVWFPARCKQDTQKVQIRSISYVDDRRTYLVGDIWNRCIKEFNEKGTFQGMWVCRLGWPIALVQTKHNNIACVEYDIGLKQCSLVVYNPKGQVQSTTALNFSGMYIGSIALTNENLIIVPNHDERKVCLYAENGKQKPELISIEGRPEFVAYIKTNGTSLVTCPQDQVVYQLKGDYVIHSIRPSDLGVKSWRPYCVAASVSDSRFVVQDGFHPDQDRLLAFDESGVLMRVLPQDRVWIRVFIDSCSRLVLCDRQNVAVYTCSWLQVNEKNEKNEKTKRSAKKGREKCSVHPKKVTEVYCADCDERICQLCSMLKHNGHTLTDLTTRESSARESTSNSNLNSNRSERDNQDTDNTDSTPMHDISPTNNKVNERDALWWLSDAPGTSASTSSAPNATSATDKKANVRKSDSLESERTLKHLVPAKEVPYKWKLYEGSRQISEFQTHRGEPAAAMVLDDNILAIERISEIQSVAVFYNMDTSVIRFVDLKYGLNPSNIIANQDGNILIPGGGETAVYLFSRDCSTCIAQHQYPNILPEFIAYSPAQNSVAVSFPSEIDPFVSVISFTNANLAGVAQQISITCKQVDNGLNDSWTPRAVCFVPSASAETLWVFDETSRRIMQFSASGKMIRTVAHDIDDCEYLYTLGTNKVLSVGRTSTQEIEAAES